MADAHAFLDGGDLHQPHAHQGAVKDAVDEGRHAGDSQWTFHAATVTNNSDVLKSLYEQLACSFRVLFNRGMSNADRRRLIAQAVQDSGSAVVPELAELTGASEMTIRRDLDTLAAQGVLERFRGGARTLLLRGEEPPFALRAHEAVDAKRRIAAEVSRLIADGAVVARHPHAQRRPRSDHPHGAGWTAPQR